MAEFKFDINNTAWTEATGLVADTPYSIKVRDNFCHGITSPTQPDINETVFRVIEDQQLVKLNTGEKLWLKSDTSSGDTVTISNSVFNSASAVGIVTNGGGGTNQLTPSELKFAQKGTANNALHVFAGNDTFNTSSDDFFAVRLDLFNFSANESSEDIINSVDVITPTSNDPISNTLFASRGCFSLKNLDPNVVFRLRFNLGAASNSAVSIGMFETKVNPTTNLSFYNNPLWTNFVNGTGLTKTEIESLVDLFPNDNFEFVNPKQILKDSANVAETFEAKSSLKFVDGNPILYFIPFVVTDQNETGFEISLVQIHTKYK